jgi:cell division transport system permease protein
MIFFYLKESVKSLTRQKGSTLITILTLVISIFITSSAIVSVYLSQYYSNSLISSIKVNLFLVNDISKSDKEYIFERLRSERFIRFFEFVNKEKAKKEFIKETGEDFSDFLEINPLPESIRLTLRAELISVSKIQLFINKLKGIKGVDEVVYDYEYLFKLINFINSVRYSLYLLSFISIIISIYLIYATNKLIYNSRIETYNIMKLVGAKLSAIKIPIYLSSILLGMTASTISVILSFFLIIGLTNIFNIVNFTKWIIIISLIMAGLGLLFGILGGIFSTKNINLKIERG